MTKISMQCNALPSEILAMLASALPGNVAILVYQRRGRPIYKRIDRNNISDLDDGSPQSLCITNYDPVMDVESEREFYKKNENILSVDVGAIKNRELSESSFGGIFNENGEWIRSVMRALKKGMKAGAKVRNRSTGAEGYSKNHWLPGRR